MEKIKASLILEILGRPPEYLMESLKMLLDAMDKETGIKIIEKRVHEPIQAPDSKDLFTSFAEITIEADSLETYVAIVFKYMPANVEIINPENMTLRNSDLSLLTNRIVLRLHEYDAIAKRLVVDNDMLKKKLFEVAPHLFKQQPAQQINMSKKEDKKAEKKPKKTKKTKKK